MALSIGIVGLPNVGKSTLFNALTSNDVLAANYPFATIEPNVGVVAVPDERLMRLGALFKPEKVTPTTVNFVDIAGLVGGAHQGEGLGNRFLAHIREVDAIAQVVRTFEDPNVAHVEKDINPERDIATINTELVLADLQTITKRIEKIAPDAKGSAASKQSLDWLETLRKHLDKGEVLSSALGSGQLAAEQQALLRELNFLTCKPFIYVFNVDDSAPNNEANRQKLAQLVAPSEAVFVAAALEAQLQDLSPSERTELLRASGQAQSGLDLLIRAGYAALGLITFFTAGAKEVRAWTVPKGTLAPAAAGRIHGDFERGFIAAEVVAYEALHTAGGLAAAKAQGQVRTEGKDYAVQDGDVIEFKFNV